MAATGYTPIYLYYSSTTTNQPSAGNLGYGELAINITDGYLFYKDNANAIQKIGYKLVPITNGGTNATSFNAPVSNINGLVWYDGTRLVNDATTSDVGYNSSTNTFYARTLNLTNALGTAYGGTGLTSFTSGGVVYASSTSALTTGSGLSFDGTNLGVGTATPGYRVHAYGNAAAANIWTTSQNTNATGGAGFIAYASGANANYYSTFVIDPSGNTGVTGAVSGTGVMYFTNAGVEFMRANASAVLMIGTTSSSFGQSGFIFNPNYSASGNSGAAIQHANGSASGSNYLSFIYNAGQIGNIYQSGTTAIVYATTSDYRLKNNPVPLTDTGETIDALNPVSWTWEQDGSIGKGFLAHEFQKVFFNSVSGKKDDIDSQNNPIYQAMDASTPEVIATIVAELKSLRNRVKELETKVEKQNVAN